MLANLARRVVLCAQLAALLGHSAVPASAGVEAPGVRWGGHAKAPQEEDCKSWRCHFAGTLELQNRRAIPADSSCVQKRPAVLGRDCGSPCHSHKVGTNTTPPKCQYNLGLLQPQGNAKLRHSAGGPPHLARCGCT